MTAATIRAAHANDAAALAGLVSALAAEEGKTTPPASTAQLAAWMGEPDPPFTALLAEHGGEAVGYLVFYRAFSLFKPGPVLLVENIYVRPQARGTGIGRRLLAAAAAEAVRRGWPRLELNVQEANAGARAAYAALGFTTPGESVQRLEGAALAALAQGVSSDRSAG